jgi:hypothetical protein
MTRVSGQVPRHSLQLGIVMTNYSWYIPLYEGRTKGFFLKPGKLGPGIIYEGPIHVDTGLSVRVVMLAALTCPKIERKGA